MKKIVFYGTTLTFVFSVVIFIYAYISAKNAIVENDKNAKVSFRGIHISSSEFTFIFKMHDQPVFFINNKKIPAQYLTYNYRYFCYGDQTRIFISNIAEKYYDHFGWSPSMRCGNGQ